MWNKAVRPFFVYIILHFFYFQAGGQNTSQSPYSRYGVGSLYFQGFAQSSAMGQTGLALRPLNSVNIMNPASYSALSITAFETGILAEKGSLESASQKQRFSQGSYAYLSLGFPLSKKLGWGMSFGLLPMSSMGYNVTGYQFQGDSVATQLQYAGEGGLSRFYMGSGIRLAKNLSFGLNASYLVGQLRKISAAYFDDSTSLLDYRKDINSYLGDFSFELGLQYQYDISSKHKLGLGFTYAPGATIKSDQEVFARTLVPGYRLFTRDTILYDESQKGTYYIPARLAFGISLQQPDKWLLALDLHTQQWSQFKSYGRRDSLKNDLGLGIGAAYKPDANAIKGRWKRTEYRVGVRYNQSYVSIRDRQVNEYAFSLGAGIPFTRQQSKLNISLEYISRGTTDNKLLREQYYRLTLGFSLSEKWFTRYKYD